jgi:hypothetical protein
VTHFDPIAEVEERARSVRKLKRKEPPSCPICGRMITTRENEQGACDDCFG